ncbi:hypothetical protein G3I15_00610, partial [Streptomyces sp. SID10244]|nr:hypothetical protein [Streptomyces sp. SID10244]
DVVTRHEVLRTVFPAEAGRPYQRVIDVESAVSQLDWTVTDTSENALSVIAQGFDVRTELPIRGRVATLADTDHLVVLVVHHIAADGESGPVLARDLIAAYTARAR